MELLNGQIRELEIARAEAIRGQLAAEAKGESGDSQLAMVCRLLRLMAIGPASSWLFVHEVFGWRKVRNRRELASLLGLVPTPYNSGNSERDQGISKSGNGRMRRTCRVTVAAPIFSVSDGGLNGANQLWLVELAPDSSLFSDTPVGFGRSLAVELDFSVAGSDIVSATKNSTDWPFDHPGNDPFTGTVSTGVVVDFGNETAFVALGSNSFSTGDSVEVVTIETLGTGLTTLN